VSRGNKSARNPRQTHKPKPASPYVRSVLALFTRLPHTPARPRSDDRFVVSRLERQKVPLLRVQAALLLGTARRLFREDHSEPLWPIRSFRFFLPIVDELHHAHINEGYVGYLLRKLSDSLGKEISLEDPATNSRQPRPRRPQQLTLPW